VCLNGYNFKYTISPIENVLSNLFLYVYFLSLTELGLDFP
jgi:uncharacterized membrane protein YjgN (DUF898 family)